MKYPEDCEELIGISVARLVLLNAVKTYLDVCDLYRCGPGHPTCDDEAENRGLAVISSARRCSYRWQSVRETPLVLRIYSADLAAVAAAQTVDTFLVYQLLRPTFAQLHRLLQRAYGLKSREGAC